MFFKLRPAEPLNGFLIMSAVFCESGKGDIHGGIEWAVVVGDEIGSELQWEEIYAFYVQDH